MRIVFNFFILTLLELNNAQSNPPDLIDLIVNKMWQSNAPNCSMYAYQYGGAIVFDSMYKATKQFSPSMKNVNTNKVLDYNNLLLPILNEYLTTDTGTPGYMIVHNQTIPWSSSLEGAIGDHVGLFPITYLDALLYDYSKYNNNDVFNFNGKNATEWYLIFTTMDYYILEFPRRLTDQYGTVSRTSHGAWENQPDKNASFLWGDDNFMGLTLPARLAQILTFCDKEINGCNGINVQNNITQYINWVYTQNMGFSQHLIYPDSKYNGLYAHGYNYATNDHSCCPWGRANAWVMTAHVEAIKMFKYLNNTSYDKQYNDILMLYHNHINEIGSLQNTTNGRWHQVINDSSTFLETSCSTGFLYAIIYGRINNILPTNVYTLSDWDSIINLGWQGLEDIIDDTGIIKDACQGTGIENDVQQYEERSTAYCNIGNPGDAAFVINAIVGYQQYLNFKQT